MNPPRAQLFEFSFRFLISETVFPQYSVEQRLYCRQGGLAKRPPPCIRFRNYLVVIIVVVVVIVPIVVGTPPVLVFIPPSVIGGPAAFPLFVQDVTPFRRLLTLIAVVLDGLVQIVIGFCDTSLAVVISAQSWSACKHDKSGQRSSGDRDPSQE